MTMTTTGGQLQRSIAANQTNRLAGAWFGADEMYPIDAAEFMPAGSTLGAEDPLLRGRGVPLLCLRPE